MRGARGGEAIVAAAWLALAAPALSQEQAASGAAANAGANAAASATGGVLRVLDKINGTVTDLDVAVGATGEVGSLTVTLAECRYPTDNPAGDAYALVSIRTAQDETAVFEGWLVASAPALNAVDHPRYDVWALRCSGV